MDQQLQHRSRSRNLHARLEVVRSFGADAATPRDIKECGRRPSRLRFTVRVPADCLIARSGMAVGLHSRAVWTRHATSRGRRPAPQGAGSAVPPPKHQAADSCRGRAWRSHRRYGSLESHLCHLVCLCCWYETRAPRVALYSEVFPLFATSLVPL